MKWIALFLVALSVGCDLLPSPAKRNDYRGHVAATLALYTATPSDNAPSPAPEPSTHSRNDCPTGGWITHGDGHKTRCPLCDPPWIGDEPMAIELPEQEVIQVKEDPISVQVSSIATGRSCSGPLCRMRDRIKGRR